VLLAFIQGSRDKVVDETGKLIEGEALSRMKAATMRLVGMLPKPDWLTRKIYFMESFPFSVSFLIHDLRLPTII
jgi:ABC-type uncharacterized transport system YnjBCD ATPase subunit